MSAPRPLVNEHDFPRGWSIWHDPQLDTVIARRDVDDVQIHFPAPTLLAWPFVHPLPALAHRLLEQFEQRGRTAAPHSRFLFQGEGEWLSE